MAQLRILFTLDSINISHVSASGIVALLAKELEKRGYLIAPEPSMPLPFSVFQYQETFKALLLEECLKKLPRVFKSSSHTFRLYPVLNTASPIPLFCLEEQ